MAEDLSTYPGSRIALTRDGKLAINGGQILNSAGADITPMLEVLDDLTAAQITALAALSTTEIGYLDAVTPGTVLANKVVIAGTGKAIDTIDITKDGLKIGGTAVTVTAAEANLLDTAVAGTVVASKALIAGAQKDLDTLVLSAGAATPAQVLGIGPTNGTGLRRMVLRESVTIPSAQSSIALTNSVPDGAVIIAVQAQISTAVTATTATKVGVGTSGDPDKWGLTTVLTQNAKVNTLVAGGDQAAETGGSGAIGIYACDNAGDATGTINSGVVLVSIIYDELVSLPNA